MASTSTPNGIGQQFPEELSPAQKLQEKHAADAAHRPWVEDAVDEEDLARPPPSMQLASPSDDAMNEAVSQPLSEKAAGKQKARNESPGDRRASRPEAVPDTKSEDAFPALSGGPKPQSQPSVAMAWGARKPPSVATAAPNGVHGQRPASHASASHKSTSTSGKTGLATTNGVIAPHSQGSAVPQHMPMPGRYSERISFAPSQLLPRDQLKKPLQEVLRSINKSSKATVQMKSGPDGKIIFEGTGPVDAVRQALRDIAKEVGSKVCPIFLNRSERLTDFAAIRQDSHPVECAAFCHRPSRHRCTSDHRKDWGPHTGT